MSTVPVFGVLLLLACGCINGGDLVAGIAGNSDMQPYAIVLLFFSLAYLCVSLDITGVFEYISLWSIVKTNGSGLKLFFSVFLLCTLMTLVTSTDVVILTLTPIICLLARHTHIDPMPFLMLQFYTANILSIFLYIGNSTNIIVAQANKISFLGYSKWMTLPATVAGLSGLFLIWVRFRKKIPSRVEVPDVDPVKALKDKKGAVFGCVCLGICLVMLVSSPWLPIPIYIITTSFMGVFLIKDILHSMYQGPIVVHDSALLEMGVIRKDNQEKIDQETQVDDQEEPEESGRNSRHLSISTSGSVSRNENEESQVGSRNERQGPIEKKSVSGSKSEEKKSSGERDVVVAITNIFSADVSACDTGDSKNAVTESPVSKWQLQDSESSEEDLTKKEYQLFIVLKRLPWPVIPFLFSTFIIVEALGVAGWNSKLAHLFSLAIGPTDTVTSITISVFLIGLSSSVISNIINTQPMTILFTAILSEPSFVVGPNSKLAAMLSLVMGSNLGPNFTLMGTIAGLMWSRILEKKGFSITYLQFALYGITLMPLIVGLSCATLVAEFVLF
eukprot:TRINITY_DN4842_c0_g1_i1.p1 TRINITY_DN4842_c0_g1~~TRINITY_DN4842_c0_g1_i1.p1  ORF type:complete len:633 (-),score=108.15 TRINITY_DN4842_c0_g1_i1:36-1712(-)